MKIIQTKKISIYKKFGINVPKFCKNKEINQKICNNQLKN